MSSDWQLKKLGDHCLKIGSGATPKGGKESYLDNGPFRLIRSQNVYNEGFSPSGLAYIDEEQAKRLDGVAVEENDVLLNITGDSVARVCLAPKKYLPARVNQHVAIIRPNPNVFDSRYIRYFLASRQQQDFMLGLAAAGATRNALTKGMIEGFEIPAPSIEIQHSIADTLGSLDDRISLLRKTNKTLEAIAQAIFKSWFIDFDPVRAKMEGRIPAGLDEETAALFPDELVESELGLVPKGWLVSKIADVAEVTKGKSYKSDELVEKHTTALVTLKSFQRGGGFRLDGFKPYTGSYKESQVVSPGDLIVAYTDVTQAAELIGKPAIVVGVAGFEKLVASLDVGIVRPVGNVTRQYLYGLFKTDNFSAHTLAHTSGTTVLHLPKDAVGNFKFAMPNLNLVEKFDEIAQLFSGRIQNNIDMARALGAIRETLLPRLISGKLRISDDELVSQT